MDEYRLRVWRYDGDAVEFRCGIGPAAVAAHHKRRGMHPSAAPPRR